MKKFFDSWIGTVIIAVVLTLIVRFYVAQPFIVRGASMEPNFEDVDYLIVDALSYAIRQPERGEVIVFHYPQDPKQFFIKRIIGLPTETIVLQNGRISITRDGNSFVFEEPYLDRAAEQNTGFYTFTLGPDEYMVLGDNRGESSDSRMWGKLEEHFIVGRAMIRLWPLQGITLIPKTQTTR